MSSDDAVHPIKEIMTVKDSLSYEKSLASHKPLNVPSSKKAGRLVYNQYLS